MKTSHLLSLSLLPALLAGCNVGPKFTSPETKTDARFASSKREGSFSADNEVATWWRKFNDSKLNSLIERAFANSPDLRIAAARVDEARALHSAARFDYFPTVTSDASYLNQRSSIAQSGFGRSRNLELYEVGLDGFYEVDFWGRVRNNNKAALAELGTAEALRRDALVLLASDVASNYMQLRGLQNELAVAQRNATNQRDTLKLTESLLQGGRGTELDTSRARAQLNSTLAAIPVIESAIRRNIHRISVLTGQQPQVLLDELLKSKPMPTLPSIVRVGSPAELLRRRPDIRAAEFQIEAATARVGVATADLFPRVTFNGRVALQAESFSGLAKSGADAYSFGPSISWAAFDLGRVKAQIDASKARNVQSIAQYEQTVLGALEETENAMTSFGRQRARRDFLREASAASQQAAKLARERYQNGVADFLTVLDAERVMLEAESRQAESETLTAVALVAIYKSLGGGWETNGRVSAK
ncbi:multidrug efflux system outer membrane protein [Roseimicrobium gellanilyticum]|uniref:Multidrug efflux system outer membrane protein n=1 Tax=Roseimicrobium gellanilyticum TaxID=748857 RepID=A0A366H1Z9_9BACT|nr:efflux transporter outer membrane subunit [Roseimicrobium gellanilyticum]RBP35912.1 multidrug efflux system outer membrane protein [Roseimicrobium gellanilyticum]